VAALVWAMQSGRSAMAPFGLFLGSWLVFGSAVDLWSRTGRKGYRARLGRLTRLPRADWGKATAHAGMGVTIAGIAGLLAWEAEDIRVAKPGDRFEISGYTIALMDVQDIAGPNYQSRLAEFDLLKGTTVIGTVYPEKRFYPVAEMATTEAGIDNGFLRDIYVVIGDPQDGGGWAVRTYVKPLANWIWGGAILMALGGFLSLSDRRYRVAAGAKKTIPEGVPAE